MDQDVFLKGTGIVDNEGLVGRQAGKVSAQIVAARSVGGIQCVAHPTLLLLTSIGTGSWAVR